jgi:hypothetical protein
MGMSIQEGASLQFEKRAELEEYEKYDFIN